MIWVPKFLTKLRDIPTPIASKFLKRNAGDSAFEWADAGGGGTLTYMHVRDEKANGTNGGAHTIGTNLRVLNTVVFNNISGASLASDKFTLPSGTYTIHAIAPTRLGDYTRLDLYDFTNSITKLLGLNMYAPNTPENHPVPLIGIFDVTGITQFGLNQYISGNGGYPGFVGGLGYALPDSNIEVYASVFITKVA